MEEYYAGGKRDEFKNEFKNAVEKGRAKVKQTIVDGITAATTQKALATDDVEDTSTNNNIKAQIISKLGYYTGGFYDRWDWFSPMDKSITDEQLWETYQKLRK